MWEGSAEYMALEARISVTKRLNKKGRLDHVEKALNGCVATLLDRPFTGSRTNATYVCGETLFWLADAAEKKRSTGRGDIFTLWRHILDKAEANGGVYGPGDVLTTIAPDEPAKQALSLFLAETGGERWQELPARVAPLGVKLEAGPTSDEVLRTTAIFHILNQYCTGSRGMWTETGYLKLDTGDRCGPLNGDKDIDALNGHNLFTDMPAAYAAAMRACADKGEIVLSRTGRPDKVSATCTKPLSAAPPGFRIRSAP